MRRVRGSLGNHSGSGVAKEHRIRSIRSRLPVKRDRSWPCVGRPVVAFVLLALTGCTRDKARDGNSGASAPVQVSSVATELATLDLPGLQTASSPGADPPHVEAFVNPQGTGGAFVVRYAHSARLVRGRTVGPEYPGIDLVTLSPDGRRVAFAVSQMGKARVVLDGEHGPPFDAVEGLVFTRDGHLAYKGRRGERWRLVVDRTEGEERFALGDLHVDGNGGTVVVAEKASATSPFSVASYDARLRRKAVREIAAEEVVLNGHATLAAAIVDTGGKKKVTVFDLAGPSPLREGALYDSVTGVAFDATGTRVMYGAYKGGQLLFALDDKVEPLPATSLVERPVLNPVRGTVGVVLVTDRAFFHLVFERQAPKARHYEGVNDVTFSRDGSRCAYAAEENGRGLAVVNGKEGPAFDRVVMPRFSPDGAFLVYRARQDGKRFVVAADGDGKIVRRHPDYEQVFPPAFTADGASVAYGVKEGPRLLWMVEKLRPDG